MIPAAASIVAALVSLSPSARDDPCGAIRTSSVADPDTARLYAEVGDREKADGHDRAAAIAFARALELDPSDQRSRAVLDAVCLSLRPEPGVDEALELVEQNRCPEVLAKLSAAPDAQLSLIEGLCRLELGDEAGARTALIEAARSSSVAESANLLLAVIAYREGEEAGARSLLAPLRRSDTPGTARAAADLERLIAAGSASKVAIAAAVDAIADSNPSLSPNGDQSTPIPGQLGRPDGAIRAAAAFNARPFGTPGPYIAGAASYQKQFDLGIFDLAAFDGAAGLRIGRDDLGVAAEYAFDYEIEGGSPYSLAHNLSVRGHLIEGALRLGASYLARFETYFDRAATGYSGTFHVAGADAAFDIWPGTWAAFGYHFAMDQTDDPALRFNEHGPRLRISVRPFGPFRAIVEGDLSFRAYDPASSTAAGIRSDTEVDGLTTLELYIGGGWSVVASGIARRVLSTDPDQTYLRLIASVGLRFARGLL
jgi:hypothetical protein